MNTDSYQSNNDPFAQAMRNSVHRTIEYGFRTIFRGEIPAVFTTLKDSRMAKPIADEANRMGLVGSSIYAMDCGSKNDPYCCLMVLKQYLPELIRLNPYLENTPQTTWKDWGVIWLAVDGWRPDNQSLGKLMWISSGLVPIYQEPELSKPFEWYPSAAAPHPAIMFGKLQWPDGYAQIFYQQTIEEECGAILLTGESGNYEINHRTAATMLARLECYLYDRRKDCFIINQDPNPPTEHSEDQIQKAITTFLHAVSVRYRDKYPPNRILTRDIDIIMDYIKTTFVVNFVGERDGLRAFARKRIVKKPGGSVTTEELYVDYLGYCQQTHTMIYPRKHFYAKLPEVVRHEYASLKSHCISRATSDGDRLTARNGYFGLALRNDKDPSGG